MVDLLIKDGRVVDGTGQTWFRASVAVSGDTVQIVRGDSSAIEAPRVIDASHYVVCPGFIDMHSHLRLDDVERSAARSEDAAGRNHRGVGNGWLVVRSKLPQQPGAPADLFGGSQRNAAALSTLEQRGGVPGLVGWQGSLQRGLLRSPRGHPGEAMGWEDRLPTPQELARMQDLARQGMRDGAFGFATGLTYPPGAYSDTDELVAVSQAVGEYGGFYITHARYTLGDRLLDPFREAVEIGRRSGAPVHLSHYHSPVDGMGQRMLDLVDESRNSGVDVTFDQYPYAAASTVLHSLLPYWVHAGGPPALLERIQTREVRERIGTRLIPCGASHWTITSSATWGRTRTRSGKAAPWWTWPEPKARAWWTLFATSSSRKIWRWHSLPEPATRTTFAPSSSTQPICGLRRAAYGRDAQPKELRHVPIRSGTIRAGGGVATTRRGRSQDDQHPGATVGLERPRNPAGRHESGHSHVRPRPVQALATFEEPKQFPEGIDYVLVNGQPVIDNGAHTGALPGRALRSQ